MRRLTGLLFLLLASLAAPLSAQEAAPDASNPVTGFVADEIQLRLDKPSTPAPIAGKSQVILRFCEVQNEDNYCRQPSRAVQTAGRKVENIKIEPNIPGEWRFSSDYTLTFTPEKTWRGRTSYTVTLPADLFPPHVKRDTDTHSFTTAPLHVTIEKMDFLQDANDATKKLVTARLAFNYPVNRASLKQALSFTMEGRETALPFTLDFYNDDASANAAVEVEKLEKTQQYMKLFIAQTVSAADDSSLLTPRPEIQGKKKDNEFSERVLIPSLYDYLQVKSVLAQVLKNAQYVPQQLLAIEANAPLKPQELKAFVEARLLPRDKPVEGASPKKNYAWSGPAEVTPALRETLEPVAVTAPEDDAPPSPVNALAFAAEGGRYLLVTVKKGLPAEGGYELGRDLETVIRVPDLPREVRVMAEGALLSLSGEKKLSILSLGVNALQYEIGRVKEENLNHLISQTYGRFADPEFVNGYQFNEHNISRVFREERTLSGEDPKKPNFSSFDFTPYLQDGGKGLFLLKITGQQTTVTSETAKPQELSWWRRILAFFTGAPKQEAAPETETRTSATSPEKRFILVTDLGLIVKKNLDGTQDVFVQSIGGSGPVAGVEIAALGLNGEPVATATTDGEGHAILPNLDGFKDEKRPVAITARKNGDLSFLPYGRYDRELNYSKFDVEGERASEGLNGYVFTDRGIYRPGETAHLGLIVKAKDWTKSQKDLPLVLEIVNPRGQVADKQILKLSEEGLIAADFTVSDTAATGVYTANLYLGRADGEKGAQLASAPLRVEEFQPDRMRMSSAFTQFGLPVDKLAWVKPEQLTADVTLMHLYGAPAQERRVTAKLALSPSGFGFHTFREYSFAASNGIEKAFEETLPETKTNDQGVARFPIDLAKYQDSTFRLTFYGEGFEPDSGRSVKTAKSVLVSPLDYALGVKPDGNLNYIHVGDARSLSLIAVDQKLAKISATDVTMELKRVKTIQSLVKDNQGGYRYQPATIETPVKTESTSIPAEGGSLTLPTEEPGSFLLVYKNARGVTLARVAFTVVGESNATASFSRDAAMQVTPDKTAYGSGEEIALNIQSPYSGTGLITIETDRVIAWKWFTSDFTNSVQTIRIPEGFEGKGFVNVQFTRDLKSKEIFMSPLSFAVVPFTANIDARDQKITLNAPQEAGPGDKVVVSYSTRKPGKIVLYAVDEGILLFARYKNPDPLDHFLMKRALEVSTSQIMDLLLPEYSLLKALSAQGGDGWANDGKNLNPFKRKTEPPVAYWSGILESDDSPREWTFTVPPYFNGGVRILAVAVSSDAMGTAEAGTHVRGPLIITPNLPLFAAPGDEFDTPVTINNYVKDSGQDAKVTLTLEPSPGLAVVDAPKDPLPIPEGGEKTVSVKLKATETLGSASVKFTAASGNTSFTIEQTASIRPPLPAMTTLVTAYAKEASAIAVNARSLYPEFAKVTATASSLPVSLIGGLKDYLEDYPYGCVEQLTSQNFPNVI
ncbi:MAG: alpha-2-macroglobulin family protein, partial [Alphaproteobacteria bacterium]|nr:alpha-2-macroglobulin family protein [Alphaproteobacteria bacterium]